MHCSIEWMFIRTTVVENLGNGYDVTKASWISKRGKGLIPSKGLKMWNTQKSQLCYSKHFIWSFNKEAALFHWPETSSSILQSRFPYAWAKTKNWAQTADRYVFIGCHHGSARPRLKEVCDCWDLDGTGHPWNNLTRLRQYFTGLSAHALLYVTRSKGDKNIWNKRLSRNPCYIFLIHWIHKGNLLWTKPQDGPQGLPSRRTQVLIPHPAGLRPKLFWSLWGEVDHTLSRPDDCICVKVRATVDISNISKQTAQVKKRTFKSTAPTAIYL